MSCESEIDRLADFILKNYPYEIGKETSESAVDVAIRLLKSRLKEDWEELVKEAHNIGHKDGLIKGRKEGLSLKIKGM